MNNNKYSATWIGLLFTIACLIGAMTDIAAFITILPLSYLLESFFHLFFSDYSKIGTSVIIALLIILIGISSLSFLRIYHQIRDYNSYKTSEIVLYMSLLLFVIHPLIFYINLSNDWSRASDGQFIFSINETFHISSWAFVIIGALIDYIFYKRAFINP